jgi:hypothetical protein
MAFCRTLCDSFVFAGSNNGNAALAHQATQTKTGLSFDVPSVTRPDRCLRLAGRLQYARKPRMLQLGNITFATQAFQHGPDNFFR